jgi:DNA mismatch endonuclease, patch repair protein
MADVLTQEQRRLNMSRIKGRDTKPERQLRSALHGMGLRFRLHRRDLPGRPDIVFSRQRTLIFVHGCFWHAHGCSYSVLPATRTEFWQKKLAGNRERDERVIDALRNMGWRVIVVWECALRGRSRHSMEKICGRICRFLIGSRRILEVTGVRATRIPRKEAI